MTVLVACLGYLLGSVPFAFLFARRAKGVDLRLIGSGNVGAANVLRTTTRTAALCVMLLDVGKGAAAVIVARLFQADLPSQVVAGVAAVVGHADRVVRVDGDGDAGTVAGQRFVDGVVDHLIDQVVEAAGAGRTDVHAGPFADRLETFENLDVLGVVVRLLHATSQCAEGMGRGAAGRLVLPA